jgi:DNA polymerase-3 subunit epsilon
MYLVFDTETNGKIKNYSLKPSKDTLDNFPRVAQLAFGLYKENGDLRIAYNFIIKPDGWEIPKEKFFIDHNLTTERCELIGIPIKDALNQFLVEIQNSQYLIAHNISFDHPVLSSEMIRLGLSSSRKLEKICTMKSTMDFCQLPPYRYGEYKYPKLEELHRKLFDCEFEDAHDAFGDVKATAKCFFELKKRGII